MTDPLRYGSVCSGIEAATCAWHPLGWQAAWLAEIEPFPSAVLKHHYPDVPNLGDMTNIADRILAGDVEAPDILTGGTPCQAFSVAGLRKGLDDQRGKLTLSFCQLANAIDAVRSAREQQPCVIVWENVPGVLSDKGNAFGCFLAGLAGEDDPLDPPGGRWANAGYVRGPTRTVCWRVLDAQYFGVAQRRRRVWVVASARKDFDPATVLFEFDGVRRDSAPSREAREGAAGGTQGGLGIGVDLQNAALTGDIAGTLDAEGQKRINRGHAVLGVDVLNNCVNENLSHTLPARNDVQCGVVAFPAEMSGTQVATAMDRAPSLSVKHTTAVAYGITDDETVMENCLPTMPTPSASGGGHPPAVQYDMHVRRLTPVECERLQGFPDNYTRIPWRKKPADQCPDGPRYKALGNSWAVPCAAWIGKRIKEELA